MLDVKLFRTEADLQRVVQAMKNRGKTLDDISRFTGLDSKRRELLQEVEQLKNRRNVVSQEVAALKKAKQDADALIEEMKGVGDRIKVLDDEIRVLEADLNVIIMAMPNIPNTSVPVGSSEEDNVEIRRVGEPVVFSFEPKAHWEIGQQLGILDFEAAAKVTGSRFVFIKALGRVWNGL